MPDIAHDIGDVKVLIRSSDGAQPSGGRDAISVARDQSASRIVILPNEPGLAIAGRANRKPLSGLLYREPAHWPAGCVSEAARWRQGV